MSRRLVASNRHRVAQSLRSMSAPSGCSLRRTCHRSSARDSPHAILSILRISWSTCWRRRRISAANGGCFAAPAMRDAPSEGGHIEAAASRPRASPTGWEGGGEAILAVWIVGLRRASRPSARESPSACYVRPCDLGSVLGRTSVDVGWYEGDEVHESFVWADSTGCGERPGKR